MTESQIHEVAACAANLKPKPYERSRAVDRLVADGRAEWVDAFTWRLTEKGLQWLGRIGYRLPHDREFDLPGDFGPVRVRQISENPQASDLRVFGQSAER